MFKGEQTINNAPFVPNLDALVDGDRLFPSIGSNENIFFSEIRQKERPYDLKKRKSSSLCYLLKNDHMIELLFSMKMGPMLKQRKF